MGRLHCKRCSKEVHPGRGDYYLVRIEAVADPQPPVITQEDLDQDVGAEIERLICLMKGLSEQQLEQGLRTRMSRLGALGKLGLPLLYSQAGQQSNAFCSIDRQDYTTSSGTSAP